MPNKPPQCELLRATDLLQNEELPVKEQRTMREVACGGCAVRGWLQTQVHDWPPHEETPRKVVIMDSPLADCPKLPDMQQNDIDYVRLTDLDNERKS